MSDDRHIQFVKMHGIGNDYVYIDATREDPGDPVELARLVSDRNFGIGGDGLILICPPSEGVDADVRMRMFNADGTESQMCGNGARCVAKYAVDSGMSTSHPLKLQTDAGVLSVQYETDQHGRVRSATIDMGRPVLDAASIPVIIPGHDPAQRVLDQQLPTETWPGSIEWIGPAGLQASLTAVSMGNPHAVIYCSDVEKVPLERIGPFLECHGWFPERINVHFVQVVREDHVIMRTWERGSGITLACGTGASAVCVAGVLTGRTGPRLTTELPGGTLLIQWSDMDGPVHMTGPAHEVFRGRFDPEHAWSDVRG